MDHKVIPNPQCPRSFAHMMLSRSVEVSTPVLLGVWVIFSVLIYFWQQRLSQAFELKIHFLSGLMILFYLPKDILAGILPFMPLKNPSVLFQNGLVWFLVVLS